MWVVDFSQKVVGSLYTMARDHDHKNVESPQNISKGNPMKIQN
jgi:hypothetical protein